MAWFSGMALRITQGENENRGEVLELHDREITLGRAFGKGERAPGCLFFEEPTVSRTHAVLSWDDRRGRYAIRHQSKTNPTLVNGKPVERQLLEPGCSIQLGLLVLELIPWRETRRPSKPAAAPVRSAREALARANGADRGVLARRRRVAPR
ncbi:MAG: FHA domain-containing protein [Armatimonadetes bacterium]|nr:FHA domain-containing protein [Armatimonadota bacterium]